MNFQQQQIPFSRNQTNDNHPNGKNCFNVQLVGYDLSRNTIISKEDIDYYKLFKPLNSLYKLGLKQYVRDFILEFNLDALNL